MAFIELFDELDVQDWRKKKRHEGEKNFGPSLVEKGESLPTKVMIDRMMQAGVRLAESRQAYYDFQPGEEVPDEFVPPPVGMDFAEGAAQGEALVSRVNLKAAAKRAAKEKLDADRIARGKVSGDKPEDGESATVS